MPTPLILLRRVLLCVAAGCLAAGATGFAAQPAKPNVLIIISDDLNCRLGCYGAAEAKTPNIDRLAARGVRFDRAYCNYPVCNVSRTSFLSGRYPEVTGVLNNNTDPRIRLGRDFQFLPEYFRSQGYFAAGCGKIAHGSYNATLKWDYYSEPQQGIDAEAGGGRAEKQGKNARKAGKAGKGKAAAATRTGPDVPFGWQATKNDDAGEPDGQTARRLLKYLSEHQGKPFFIAAGFHKPHVPHTAPEKYFALHEPAKMPTPPEPPGHEKDIPAIARAPKYEPNLSLEQRRAIIQHYYAATSFMDAQVGLLLDEMDRLKLWDSTVVIFMSDHGWHLGEHGGFYAKMSIMDESARAPLIAAGAGIKPAGVAKGMIEYVDVFPTLVEMTGLPKPAGLQGVSFAPLLREPGKPGRDAVYSIVMRGATQAGRALHTPEFTYLEWPDGTQQLYNAIADPHEYVNLAKDPPHAGKLAEMKRALEQRRTELGIADAELPERKGRRKQ
ncbi:MAG: sulfatase [Opitutaceae bacterium]|nr:sulfatase [Opitutaceae bacterium]